MMPLDHDHPAMAEAWRNADAALARARREQLASRDAQRLRRERMGREAVRAENLRNQQARRARIAERCKDRRDVIALLDAWRAAR